jgi:hypothetical protein
VVFFIFVWAECRYAANPPLHLDAFNVDVAFLLTATAYGWAMFGMWSLYIVLIFENIRGLSPLHTAFWTMPVIVSGHLASVIIEMASTINIHGGKHIRAQLLQHH